MYWQAAVPRPPPPGGGSSGKADGDVPANPNQRNAEGKLPLQIAIEQGNATKVNALLGQGATANEGWEGKTLAHLAAETGSLEMVKALGAKGADLKALTQRDKFTVLHFAGSRAVAEYLAEQGLEINAASVFREAPIHLAARRGRPEVVAYLLEKGADPNAQARDMDVAVLNYASTGPVAELLISKGAAVDGVLNKNLRLIPPILNAAREGRGDVVQVLLSKGANINSAGSSGDSTALDLAVDFGHAEIVKTLLAKGGLTAPRNQNFQSTLLTRAVSRRHPEVVKVLLENGDDPNQPGKQSALTEAAVLGDVEMVKMLLDKGADPRVQGNQPTALHAAARGQVPGGLRIAGASQKKGSTPGDYLSCMKMLLEKGADPGAKNYSDVTPLHVAATHNFKDGVDLLIEKGANPNAKDKVSATPLHWAAVNNAVEAATLLLAKGADANAELGVQASVTTSRAGEVPNPFGGRKVSHQRPLDVATTPAFKALLIKAGATAGPTADK